MKDFEENISIIGPLIIDQFMSTILSTACLVTRPIASLVELAIDASSATTPAFAKVFMNDLSTRLFVA